MGVIKFGTTSMKISKYWIICIVNCILNMPPNKKFSRCDRRWPYYPNQCSHFTRLSNWSFFWLKPPQQQVCNMQVYHPAEKELLFAMLFSRVVKKKNPKKVHHVHVVTSCNFLINEERFVDDNNIQTFRLNDFYKLFLCLPLKYFPYCWIYFLFTLPLHQYKAQEPITVKSYCMKLL